jgi:hypothetical protein
MELNLKVPNIFSVLKISRQEIRHSNFLGWIFDPDCSHGVGDIILHKFLREIFQDEKVKNYLFFDADLFDLNKTAT